MKQLIATIGVILCLSTGVDAQRKTYVGIEFGVAGDIYRIEDTGDYLKTIPLVNALGGINLRQELNQRLFIEAGVILKYYWEGFGFKPIDYRGSSSSDNSWLIPVRLGLNVYKERIRFVPVLGYSLGINPPFGYGIGYGTQTSGSTEINYSYTENPNVSRIFSLVQTGIGIEFEVFKVLTCSVSGNYYFGFNNITQLDISYSVNGASPMTGTATSRGDYWNFGVGVKYPVGDL